MLPPGPQEFRTKKSLFTRHEPIHFQALSPAERLDDLVWADLCDLLTHPEQISQALARAHGGHWMPQEMQERQQGLRRVLSQYFI